MTRRVLDVGQCDPDHSTITTFLQSSFPNVEVVRAHLFDDAMQQIRAGHFDLVLVNRLLDRDHSEGADVITAMMADATLSSTPVMLVSNFEDAQAAAVQLGAKMGFGKAALLATEGGKAQVVELLSPILA